MTGIKYLMRETPESSLAPSSMWGHSKRMTIYEPRSGPSSDTESAGALILDFSGSETVGKKYCLGHSMFIIFVTEAQID